MKLLILLALCVACTLAIENGLGRLPPMGWRSWNAFHSNIDQATMIAAAKTLVDKSRMVNGKPTSLLELGYVSVGLDDNWQQCGAGINGSFHDKDGHPIINLKRFPSMKDMNKEIHAMGLKSGWYMNNCICNEHRLEPNWPPQMHGDTSAIVDLGYDGVKIDGCGPSHNTTEWAELLNKTGKAIMMENCHDNTTFPFWNDPQTHDRLECPMNFWRVSSDIEPVWKTIIYNLQHVIPFQDLKNPMSRPGCWNYPDMLEVGNGDLTFIESRSHFGAWCVVSSPLILGFDTTDKTRMDSSWPIISNTEAIAVSQTWAGHPGRLVKQAKEKIQFDFEPVNIRPNTPPVTDAGAWQVWAKTLGKGAQAALLLNVASNSTTISVTPTELGFQEHEKIRVRDIWEHKDLPPMSGDQTYTVTLEAHDSKFLRMEPIV